MNYDLYQGNQDGDMTGMMDHDPPTPLDDLNDTIAGLEAFNDATSTTTTSRTTGTGKDTAGMGYGNLSDSDEQQGAGATSGAAGNHMRDYGTID